LSKSYSPKNYFQNCCCEKWLKKSFHQKKRCRQKVVVKNVLVKSSRQKNFHQKNCCQNINQINCCQKIHQKSVGKNNALQKNCCQKSLYKKKFLKKVHVKNYLYLQFFLAGVLAQALNLLFFILSCH
jgi:hypothetical protein